MNPLFLLKVSRPGLWFATVWLYLLPTSQQSEIWYSPIFWLGLIYVCFPLNLLVYGWNDSVDYDTDQLNIRKDSFWFGAKGTQKQLQNLWKPILVTQLLFYPLLIWFGGWQMIPLLFGMLLVNYLYNLPEKGLRGKPPLELLCQVGYLLIAPLSIYLNQVDHLPFATYLYLFLFAVQSHIMGEVMDIEPDRKSNRKTTATVLGTAKTKMIIMLLVLIEVILLLFYFNDKFFAGFLGLGLVWLLIDLLIIFKTKKYTLGQMKLFAFGSNALAVISMVYVWISGCLLG